MPQAHSVDRRTLQPVSQNALQLFQTSGALSRDKPSVSR